MSAYPKIFTVTSIGSSGVSTLWESSLVDKECSPIAMAIPPEFEGPGGTYSPEDLYAMSLMNCYLATFKYIAEKSKLHYETIEGRATLLVNPGADKTPWMEQVSIKISLNGAATPERAMSILNKTKSHCMIINSVKTQVDFEFSVNQ